MAAGMSTDADPARLTKGLGERWAIIETSFKFHAACRHTHLAADALLAVTAEHGLKPDEIERVTAHVHQGAIDVLSAVVSPSTVRQAKFYMGTVLGLAAHHGCAGALEFEHGYAVPSVVDFRDRVEMVIDEEVDRAYSERWIGKVTVLTRDGRELGGRVDEPKGEPECRSVPRFDLGKPDEDIDLRHAAFGFPHANKDPYTTAARRRTHR
jgi:2-methylcitrate dehydratase PrpD